MMSSTDKMTTEGQEKHQYQHKKLGDLMDEVDDLLTQKRAALNHKAEEKVHKLLNELSKLHQEIKQLAKQEYVDTKTLGTKQNELNHIENQCVQGVYGAQAQICSLDQRGQLVHHVRVETVPAGQATIRNLIEKCHQMLTRILDRVESSPTAAGEQQGQIKTPGQTGKETSTQGQKESIGAGGGAGISAH